MGQPLTNSFPLALGSIHGQSAILLPAALTMPKHNLSTSIRLMVLFLHMYVSILSLVFFLFVDLIQNGNLINTEELMRYMDASAHRHINTASDSELLLNIFANNLQQTGKFRINEEDIFTAIGAMMGQCKGAYACVAMLAGFGIIAFRDPNGIRPVGMASRKTTSGTDYMFASESVVADASGFMEWQDVKPGMFLLFFFPSV